MGFQNTSKILSVIFILAIYGATRVATFSLQYRGNTQDAEHPDYCYYEELKLTVPQNETVYPTNQEHYCVSVYCREDFVLMIRHCERIPMHRAGCQLSTNDYTRPYPECCPKVVCENEVK